MVLLLIAKALYFFLPAYCANMAPVIFQKLPFLAQPISTKHFGKNKTWRGIVTAIVFGTLIFLVQKHLYLQNVALFTNISLVDYSGQSFLLGLSLATGAILGDLLESYFKRQNNIAPGKVWFPWDQVDFVLGALLLSTFFYVVPGETLFILLTVSPLLHIATNHVSYFLGFRKSKW